MKLVTLFDTSIASENIGDFIIMDAVREHLDDICLSQHIVTLPTHDYIGSEGRRLLSASEFSLVGGTNLLSSNLRKYQQWKFRLGDLRCLNKAVLMGVGWWQYQGYADAYSSVIWRRVLNKNMLHSVRDSFTEKQLVKIGVKNVVNTSCPTMWNLTSEYCSSIPKVKGVQAVFTLTDYNQDPELDVKLIKTLMENYEELYFWPQGSRDVCYFKEITSRLQCNIVILPSNLQALNSVLSKPGIDYIGTRLHAGIRALQYKVRAIIIGIDNRAAEKANDFNIVVLNRKEIKKLDSLINSNIHTEIILPFEKIREWKSQF